MNIALPSLLDPILIIGVLFLAVALAAMALPDRVRQLPGGHIAVSLRLPLVLVGVVLLASTLLVATPMTRVPNPIPATVESIAVGRDVYLNNCARCHGVDARGGGPDAPTTKVRPPPLAGPGSHLDHHTDGDLFHVISEGLPGGMPAFEGVLTDDEMWHVVNFLRSLDSAAT